MASSVVDYLDTYCERSGALGILGEPINLVTNLFFIVAAVLAARLLLQANASGRRGDLWGLVLFLFCIGVGSGLWHAYPMQATMLMDVIPITLFINLFILSTLRRLLALSWPKVGLCWVLYCAAGVVAQRLLPPDLLNGSIMYGPTYLMLAVMTAAVWRSDRQTGVAFLQALLVFTASLVFRTFDMQLCPDVVIGTHFLWHTLNAWLLWRLLSAMIRHASSR